MGRPPTLRRGDKGDEVAHLQRLVGAVVDGDFGPETEMMVRARQMLYGLAVDGVCGPKTWRAILEREPYRVPDLNGITAGEARARVAESQLGARETRQNRGPQVDVYIREAGGIVNAAPPWCGYFTAWCGMQAQERGHGLAVVRSGAARHHWQKAPADKHVERGDIRDRVPHLRGAVYVRARTSAPHNRAGIIDGRRVQGHVGIVTAAYIDGKGRVVIEGVAGNSSGAGHSTVRGSGSVARERIVEGSRAWRALAGLVLP